MKRTTTITITPLLHFASSLFFVVLLKSVLADSSYQEKKLLDLQSFQLKHLHHNALATCFSHKSSRKEDSTRLEIKHKDFCFKKSTDPYLRLKQRLILDTKQVQFLQSQIRKSISTKTQKQSDTRIPITSGTRLQILNYVITMNLGGKNMTVIVDTGSDLTWVQCQPCKSCYTQNEPLYNPTTSVTYRPIPCNSSDCRSFQDASGNPGPCGYRQSGCNYLVNYGDGSYTRGELGKERVILGKAMINKFVFGCGRSNKGLFGGASGLMGLGNSALSFVTQTSNQFGGVFSYCLPSSDLGDSGSLNLGGNYSMYKNVTPISYTKMVHSPGLSTFYMLNLTGIRVGGVGLNSTSFGQNGVLLDSGTVITRLPPSVYTALKAEFVKQFSGFPEAPAFSILDTCFNLSTYKEVNIPTVQMAFEGNAELNVHVNGIFYFVKPDASQICLAFASLMYEDEIAIIGNYQQQNLRVVYDTKQFVVGFAEEECSFD
ncbi:hypothetical protein RND81_06G080900 [Saponaria officinalis]|uniref:Peptidase A1 domain-containing protein n=1 Tax=Saponaria officinalis TaxID=3572 RepID=A0AAW1KB83_SAPOF